MRLNRPIQAGGWPCRTPGPALPEVSERRACRVLGVARSALHALPPRPRCDRERGDALERRLAELITPYTPEQNGVVERWFRSLSEECVWIDRFEDFAAAWRAIAVWIRWYNAERPHQALGYRSPAEVRAHIPRRVA